MEFVDVVDAHDNIVGSASREEVHKKELLHRGVSVLVFNPEGKVFIQKRSPKKDVFPGFWECSISGHVQKGETEKDAALRELDEELGIRVTGKKLTELGKAGFHVGAERMLATFFVLRDIKTEIKMLEGATDGSFVELKDVEPSKFHPIAKLALDMFSSHKAAKKDFV